jgi:hypothetical protein
MRFLVAVVFLLASVFSVAQNYPSAILKSIMKANDDGRYEEIRSLLWSDSNQEDIIKALQLIKSTYGTANYFLQTDSVYRTSDLQPRKYYQFCYNTYYPHDLLVFGFVVTKEKSGYKLASIAVDPRKGNYNDPLMNYGVLTVPKVFVNNVTNGKTKEAYSLLAPSLTASLSEESFSRMSATINESLGELKAIEFIDTCTALNLYGENESIGLFAAKLIGSKSNMFFNGTVIMTNTGTFFLTRFQLFEELQLNNSAEQKAAENLIGRFYFAWSTGAYDKLYNLLHPDLQEVNTLTEITDLLENVKTAAGKHKGHSAVSQIFSRNRNTSELNKFMLIMKNENENKQLYDNFVLCYDAENELKIGYFYFVEY